MKHTSTSLGRSSALHLSFPCSKIDDQLGSWKLYQLHVSPSNFEYPIVDLNPTLEAAEEDFDAPQRLKCATYYPQIDQSRLRFLLTWSCGRQFQPHVWLNWPGHHHGRLSNLRRPLVQSDDPETTFLQAECV